MRYKHLTKVNRLEISILLNKGHGVRDIASALGYNPSSISREIMNNSVSGIYDPYKAQHKAYVHRKYSKFQGMKVKDSRDLEERIINDLKSSLTPEQIAGRLKYENDNQTVVSARCIYKYIYSPSGRYLRLSDYLPSHRIRPKHRYGKKRQKIKISNRISIRLRPAVVLTNTRFGDFEGDTLGRPKGEADTLVGAVERKSLYLLARRVRRLKYSMDGFKSILNPHHNLIKSLTLDNGLENFRHQELGIDTYFCDPYSSWQKPLIENSFGRLRRFIPKGSKLVNYTDEKISAIIELMNNTPRKRLGFRTPQEVFSELYLKERCCT